MYRSIIYAIAAAAALALASPAGATIVNLDGHANASIDGSNAQTVHFGPGRYNVTFAMDYYTAFSRWNHESGCHADGTLCSAGWENSAVIKVGSQTYYFGDSDGNGGLGPNLADTSYFETAAQSFAHSSAYALDFTLAAPSDVLFYIYDDILSDNRGGISLLVSVPAPAGWPFLLVGFAALGLLVRRRRQSARA